MFAIDIRRWVPKFILADRNGYALAKALEAGLKYMNAAVRSGVGLMNEFETMPEWRLDELAWEYNVPYDYSASVETKRKWISEVYPMYRLWGTAEGVVRYMDAYFDGSSLEESWEYDGQPFHFRLDLNGCWTAENYAWATMATNRVKNLRSVVDRYHYTAVWDQIVHFADSFYAMDNGEFEVSKQDAELLDYYGDEDSDMLLDENGMPFLAEV